MDKACVSGDFDLLDLLLRLTFFPSAFSARGVEDDGADAKPSAIPCLKKKINFETTL